MASARVIHIAERDTALEEEASTAARLVAAIQGGDEAAKDEMYLRYREGLQWLVKRKVRDGDRASDIVQDTFRIILEKLADDELEHPERLAGYLRGISRNLVSAHFRKQKREPVPADGDLIDQVQDVGPGQFETVSQKQTSEIVRQVLDSLPQDRDRKMLIRLYIDDQDRAEIRKAMNMTPHQMDVALSRARARLKALIMKSDIAPEFVTR